MIKYHTLSNFATMAQQVAHVIGNDEVISSNLISSSIVNNKYKPSSLVWRLMFL